MTRVGVLGSGRIGQVHATSLSRLRQAELVAVSDALPEAANALASATGAEVRDTDGIVQAGDVDAVVICTPTDTHADLIEAAAHAGKAIFCEKPVDLDADRVRACLDVVDSTGAVLMIGFQRRFDPHFRALKAALTDGKIGRIEQITITSRDPGPPLIGYIERSGGIFRDMTIHDFDMARFLLDAPVRRVLATGGVLVDPAIGDAGDFDTATVLLEAEGGAQVVISNSRRATYGYDQRVEVLGACGMLQVSNVPEANVTTSTDAGIGGTPLLDFFMTRYMPAYEAEMQAFLSVVTDGGAPPITGRDGLEALLLADAAMRSASEGIWVTL